MNTVEEVVNVDDEVWVKVRHWLPSSLCSSAESCSYVAACAELASALHFTEGVLDLDLQVQEIRDGDRVSLTCKVSLNQLLWSIILRLYCCRASS